DDADASKAMVLFRHQEHAGIAADIVQRQSHRHAGKDDGVVQCHDSEFGHGASFTVLDAVVRSGGAGSRLKREDARLLPSVPRKETSLGSVIAETVSATERTGYH